jgi:opacity protein-like surface antigen
MNFFSGLIEKLGDCSLKAAVASVILGLSVPSAHAASCWAGGTDADDVPVAQNFGTSMGAVVASVIGATSAVNSAILGQGSSAFVSSPADPSPDQQGGGVWTRGVGGSLNSSHALTAISIDQPGNGSGGDTDNGNANCALRLHQTFAGVQAGTDFARLNLGGSGGNIHFGLTAGYSEIQSNDVDGAFRGSFNVPFIGLYSVFTYGNFFVDAQVRGDFYQNTLTDPLSGLFAQKANATASSFAANAGYHFDLGSSWFLEPSAGVLWSHTNIDDINATGQLLVFGPPGGTSTATYPATLHFGGIESLLGRFSLRLGTSFSTAGVLFTPFVTGGYYREFDSGVLSSSLVSTVNLAPNPGSAAAFPGTGLCGASIAINNSDACNYLVSLQMTRPTSFSQVSVGSSFNLLNTGWLGYVRADYRSGSDIYGYSVSGGLRYQFTPLRVAPTVMPTKAPVVAARAYDWTGFYLGGFIGGITADTGWSYLGATNLSLPDPRTSVHAAGFLGGGTVGYNWQFGRVVAGFESDLGWSNAKGARSVPCPAGFLFNCETSIDWMSTVTGRLGYSFDRLLVYSKGGLAVANVSAASIWNPGIIPLNPQVVAFGAQPTPAAPAFRGSDTAVGWTLGGGFEFALAQNWSSKAEAMYYDLGSATYQLDAPVRVSRNGVIGRVGVNYHFN